MRDTLKFLRALTRTNLRASVALRGAFWTRVTFMFLNNFIFLVMWWVFFEKYDTVRGWRMADMTAIYGVGAGAFGLAVIFGNGVRELARVIVQGDLDSFLTQPKTPLLHVAGARSEASGWGDLASAVVLFALSGYVSPSMVPLCLVACVCGALVFIATAAMINCLAFWLGEIEALSQQATNFLLIFSLYPSSIFGGWLRAVLFSAIPAGFITFLPVDLLRDFRWTTLGAVVAAALLYTFLAGVVFALGVKRYESGNRFGVRT